MRAHLFYLNAQEHILLLTMHHIVSDDWSGGILIRELSMLYTAFVNDQPSPLLPLSIQYADFAVWQRQWLQGAVLASHMDYWKKQLHDLAPLRLPADHPRSDLGYGSFTTSAVSAL